MYDQTIGYSNSKDLIHWSEPQAIRSWLTNPQRVTPGRQSYFTTRRKSSGSSFGQRLFQISFQKTDHSGNNDLNHRIYYVTTKDFKIFSAAKLFFDPGFNVIDATLFKAGSKYYLIFKDERQNPVKKNLRLAVGDKADGPYSQVLKLSPRLGRRPVRDQDRR